MIDLIRIRRSIRTFTPEPVDRQSVDLLVETLLRAPSSRNIDPWEFVVVTDKAVLAELRAAHHGRYNGQAAIAVCANLALAGSPASQLFWQQDLAAATENILLAATGLGLGAVWTGGYPGMDRVEILRRILRIPENVYPMCLIWIGYPAESKPPRTQYDETRVHWQHYRQTSQAESKDELA